MLEGINETIKVQLDHRTIREFTEEAVPEAVSSQVMAAARQTASSTGMQACSIIKITDPELKKQLAQVCDQEYVGRAPELWIFVVDTRRNQEILKELERPTESAANMDKFFQGFTDACLMAQNVTLAVESLGMGAVYLGSILNDPVRTIELLKLPRLTFPVLGIAFGYPNQDPQLKPRMEMDVRVFENGYEVYDGEYLRRLQEYDEEMTTYYDLRESNRRSDSFTRQVGTKYAANNPRRAAMVRHIRNQGFDLRLED